MVMPITKDEALELANEELRIIEHWLKSGELVMSSVIVEGTRGWIFGYCTKKYRETKNIRDALFGPGPFLILKESGEPVWFGSGGECQKEMLQLAGLSHDEYIKQIRGR